MTKEDFLSGKVFKIKGPTYRGDATFYYSSGSLSKQIRSSIDERVIVDDYACNVRDVTKNTFSIFVFVLNKKVTNRYKYTDLVEFSQD